MQKQTDFLLKDLRTAVHLLLQQSSRKLMIKTERLLIPLTFKKKYIGHLV